MALRTNVVSMQTEQITCIWFHLSLVVCLVAEKNLETNLSSQENITSPKWAHWNTHNFFFELGLSKATWAYLHLQKQPLFPSICLSPGADTKKLQATAYPANSLSKPSGSPSLARTTTFAHSLTSWTWTTNTSLPLSSCSEQRRERSEGRGAEPPALPPLLSS